MIKILFARLQGEKDLHVCLSYLATKELSMQNVSISKVFVEECLGSNVLAFWCMSVPLGLLFVNCLRFTALESSSCVRRSCN